VDYEQAVEWLQAQTRNGRPRGPERAQELLRALGLEKPVPRFVHVVGTNGKGSVAAYLEAAFLQAGGGGAFTSPHLVSLRERVRCGGANISEAEVVVYVERARELDLEPRPAFFDLMLGMALECFLARGVDWAALEAGVGGASDATMAANGVEAVVLTNVAADHLQAFGGLENLARDKAAAARPGKPLITAVDGKYIEIVRREAEAREARLYVYDPANPLFSLPREPSLAGGFQRVNAALAAAALRLGGFDEDAVVAGLANARLPGRLQRAFLNGAEVYLDGAHNPHAATALAAAVPESYHLLFGANARKDLPGILEPLLPRARSLTFTWPLTAAPSDYGYDARYVANPEEALLDLARLGARESEPVLVTGSLYLVGRLLGSSLLH